MIVYWYVVIITLGATLILGDRFQSRRDNRYSDILISFPNMTGNIYFGDGSQNDGYIKVKNHNFSQSPLFIASGDIVGSRYSGGSEDHCSEISFS